MKITINQFAGLLTVRSDLFVQSCMAVLGHAKSNDIDYVLTQSDVDALGSYLDQNYKIAINDPIDWGDAVFGLADGETPESHQEARRASITKANSDACDIVRKLAATLSLYKPRSWTDAA